MYSPRNWPINASWFDIFPLAVLMLLFALINLSLNSFNSLSATLYRISRHSLSFPNRTHYILHCIFTRIHIYIYIHTCLKRSKSTDWEDIWRCSCSFSATARSKASLHPLNSTSRAAICASTPVFRARSRLASCTNSSTFWLTNSGLGCTDSGYSTVNAAANFPANSFSPPTPPFEHVR